MIFDRDCLLYEYDNPLILEKLREQKADIFFNFIFEDEGEDVTKVSFNWVDPIKVRDKIVATKKKQVMFLIFKSKNYACFFGNSESSIAYTITKLMEITSINLVKVNIFNLFSKYEQIKAMPRVFKLVSIDYRIRESNFDNKQNYIENIAVSDVSEVELNKLLESSRIVGLVYSMNEKYYFNIEYTSVISFYDTSDYNEVLTICNGLVENVK